MASRKFFPFTDLGNAERLCIRFMGEFHFVNGWGRFIIWNPKGRWADDRHGVGIVRLAKATLRNMEKLAKPDPTDDARMADYKKGLKKWARACETPARCNGMTYLTRDEPGVEVDHEKIDAKPWLFNCKNGTLDLKTGELRRHRASDLLMRQSPVAFDPKAKAPRWGAFLEKVVPDRDTRAFLQRFAGYCMTAEVAERMFLVIHGPRGRNGKSLFLRILQDFLGPYATTAAPGLFMAREKEAHPAEVADLFGVRMAVASESRKGRVFDEEQVKRLTGNDILKARFMHENYWSFKPTHKLVIVANHKPRVKDASDSFWDRIALVPFMTRITEAEDDKSLLEKIQRELPGILNWAFEGLEEWRKVGLKKPRAVALATSTYRADEDQVGQFVEERLEFGPAFRATIADLAWSAKTWAESRNLPTIHLADLRERLELQGCEPGKSGGSRLWKGVRIAPKGPPPVGTKGREGHVSPPLRHIRRIK